MKRALLLVLLVMPVAACASAQAKTPVEKPALDVPPVPPRIVEPLPPDVVAQPEPVAELPAPPVPPPRRQPARESKETAKPEPPKPEPAPVDQPAAPAPTAPMVPPLRAPGPPAADATRQVREIIDRAWKTLESIDYARLTSARQAQYDNAKQLLLQADDSLKTSNYDLAKNVADKAERIAKELQGR
jgi:outer membrane biosynthesis protein TonB